MQMYKIKKLTSSSIYTIVYRLTVDKKFYIFFKQKTNTSKIKKAKVQY
jgi:hypothetical protein